MRIIYMLILAIPFLAGNAWARQFATIEMEVDVSYAKAITAEQPITVGDKLTAKIHVSDDGLDYRLYFLNDESNEFEEAFYTLFLQQTDQCQLQLELSAFAIDQVITKSIEKRVRRLDQQSQRQPINTTHYNQLVYILDQVLPRLKFYDGWSQFLFSNSLTPSSLCNATPGTSHLQLHSDYDVEDEESLHLNLTINKIYHTNL